MSSGIQGGGDAVKALEDSMVTVAPRAASWFTYFPDNYRWSSAVCGILSSAPSGGSAIGEVDRACEAIRSRGYHVRPDYEVAGSAAFDYLATRADVDATRVGVMAVSLGGYYAPRCAAMEPRFKACIAWGAIWDYHATWERRVEAGFRASMSVAGDDISWITGAGSPQEALRKLEGFRLDGVVQRMRCAFLLAHGADDEQIPMADARALFDGVGSADKTSASSAPRRGALPALPARLPDPRHERDVRLARREAVSATT